MLYEDLAEILVDLDLRYKIFDDFGDDSDGSIIQMEPSYIQVLAPDTSNVVFIKLKRNEIGLIETIDKSDFGLVFRLARLSEISNMEIHFNKKDITFSINHKDHIFSYKNQELI